jgi:hypothetical protein
MKPRPVLSLLLWAWLVTACSSPADGQATGSLSGPIENLRSAPAGDAERTAAGEDARGYVLFAPLRSTTTYLINFDGEAVHTWPSRYYPGNSVYLLEDGNLLRTGLVNNGAFQAGGAGGIVQEIDWEGNVLWEFQYSSDRYLLHHDIERLPNGDVLMIAWDYRSAAEALAAGRNPSLLQDGALWPDKVIEVDPSTNQIVWEWHAWDHLVQDYDPARANYGIPSKHPERIDLNYTAMNVADWTHINAVDYNPEPDQILLSAHAFSEVWIIDHSTTAAEAAGHSGGRSGKGGDLLYRWGNPQAYDAGPVSDRRLFFQHDAQWIAPGLPGAGDILIFNNGDRRARPYSTIEELQLPLDAEGGYAMDGAVYSPAVSIWNYTADPAADFFAGNISGAQRLPDGNTLICNGPSGAFFEITPAGETVWTYLNPFGEGDLGNARPGNAGGVTGSENPVFRAVYYAADYAGLAERDLIVNPNAASENAQTASSSQQSQTPNPPEPRQPPRTAVRV